MNNVQVKNLSLSSIASGARLIGEPVGNSGVWSSIDVEAVINSKEDSRKPKDNKNDNNLKFDKSIDGIAIEM